MEIKKRKNAATKAAGTIWEDVTHWKGQTVAGLCIKGFAEHTSKTKRPDWYGKTVRNDSAYGHCECRPDVQRSVSIAELKKLHKRGELVPCQHCRPTGKKTSKVKAERKPPTGLTTHQKAVNALQKMTPEQQEKVKALLARHVRALRNAGAPEEDKARLINEAMELVRLEGKLPPDETPKYEPFRQYQTYVSPREL